MEEPNTKDNDNNEQKIAELVAQLGTTTNMLRLTAGVAYAHHPELPQLRAIIDALYKTPSSEGSING